MNIPLSLLICSPINGCLGQFLFFDHWESCYCEHSCCGRVKAADLMLVNPHVSSGRPGYMADP